MKTEAHVVINAALSHLQQCFLYHFERILIAGSLPMAQEKKKIVRSRKLRSFTEAPMFLIKPFSQLLICHIQRRSIQCPSLYMAFHGFKSGDDFLGRVEHLIPTFPPRLRNAGDQIHHPRSSESAFFRNISCGEVGPFVRRHNDIEGPSPAPGQNLTDGQIDMV